jgi:hypothetical protein
MKTTDKLGMTRARLKPAATKSDARFTPMSAPVAASFSWAAFNLGASRAVPHEDRCGATRRAQQAAPLRPRDSPDVSPYACRSSPVIGFLIGTPKQLEIGVTHTKQSAEAISNRDKNTTRSNTDLAVDSAGAFGYV